MSKSLCGKLYTEKKRKGTEEREAGRKPWDNGDAGVTVFSETARVVVMSNTCIY